MQSSDVKSLKTIVKTFLCQKIKDGQVEGLRITYFPSPEVVASLWVGVQKRLASKDSPKEKARLYLELGPDLLSIFWQSPGLAGKKEDLPYIQLFQQALCVSVRNRKSTQTFDGMLDYAIRTSERQQVLTTLMTSDTQADRNRAANSFAMRLFKVPRGAREGFTLDRLRKEHISLRTYENTVGQKAVAAATPVVPTARLAKALCATK